MRIISWRCKKNIGCAHQPAARIPAWTDKVNTINKAARRHILLSGMLAVFGAGGALYGVDALAAANDHSASKSVLVLGDSLSAEYGLARGAGWVALLQKRLLAQKISLDVVNASISGETTSGGYARLPALLKQNPNIVIIELGANDALRGLQLKSTESNLRAMITAVQKTNAKVLLVGMRIPPNYGRDYSDKFFGLYSEVAKQSKVPVVPFLLEGVADKPQWFQADRIHPVAEAHPIMLNNVWQELQPLIKTMLSGSK